MYFKILSVEYFLESKHLKSEFIYLTRDDEETLSLQSEKYGISYNRNIFALSDVWLFAGVVNLFAHIFKFRDSK